VIVDLKSGSRTPDSTLQLGVYALALLEQYGMHVNLGAYYMSRKGDIAEVKSLAHYSQQVVGDWFTKARMMIEQQLFIPHVSSFCSACTVRPYCPAQGGDPTILGRTLALPNLSM
jgi:CRISPR/Cas system-associated exonuclease Cas4 (RecB family)